MFTQSVSQLSVFFFGEFSPPIAQCVKDLQSEVVIVIVREEEVMMVGVKLVELTVIAEKLGVINLPWELGSHISQQQPC